MKLGLGWNQLTAWLILAVGLGLSAAAYLHLLHRTAEDAARFFEEESRDAQRAIETRLASYAGLLLGLRGLHNAAGDFEEHAFASYVSKLELSQRYPAVRRLDYLGQSSAGRMGRTLTYVAGHGGDRQANSASPETVRALFEEIRDGGTFVLSETPVAGSAHTYPLRLAIYDRGRSVDTLARRRLAFAGSVGVHLSLAQVFRDAISVQATERLRISVHVLGRQPLPGVSSPLSGRRLLLDTVGAIESSWTTPPRAGVTDVPLTLSSRLVFGGVIFDLMFSAPANAFVSPLSPILPIFTLLAGAIISLLLFTLVNSLAESRHGLEHAAAERTQDLEAINQALQEEIAGRGRLEREIFHLNVEERRRFGQDLHDNIGQRLAAMGLMLESLANEVRPGPEAVSLVGSISGHVTSAIEHTRMLARGLNPMAVEAGGFASALARLAAHARENFRVDCSLEDNGGSGTDDAVLQHNLYRITQQAITNAVTHGRASRIVIQLTRKDRGLKLAIIDNGIGLDKAPQRNSPGMGLKIMRYRCSVLGLDLRLEAPAEGGTAIVVEQRHS